MPRAARCGRHGGAGHLMFPVANGVPLRYLPIATWALIATNAVVFLFEVSLSPSELNEFLYSFALVPARYFDSGMFDSSLSPTDYLPFVSNMFLHGGWLHLIVNMWTLWLFGRAVEDQLGSGRYLAFYFACGILASVTYAVLNPNSTVPALGASGGDCRDTRLLHAIFPVLSYRCPDPDSLHTALLRGSGDAVRRPLVPLSDIRRRRGLVHTACQRRYSLVGPHRGLHRRRHSRGSVAASAPPAMAARRRWRHPGFCSLRDCLRRTIITRRIS